MSENTKSVKDTVIYKVGDTVSHKDYEKEKAVFTIKEIDESDRRFRYLLVRGVPGKKSSHHIWASAYDISHTQQPLAVDESEDTVDEKTVTDTNQ